MEIKSNATESAVDTWIADTYEAIYQSNASIDSAASSLKSAAGAQFYYKGKQRVTDMTTTEAIEILEQKIAAGEKFFKGYFAHDITEKIADYAELQAEHKALLAELSDLNDLYQGWNRFFIVNNPGGHIHSSMSCHSCRITTRFGWLPDQSGLTEADAVAAHGPHLCTFCFPSAPVEWTLGIGEEKAEDPDTCPGSGTHDVVKGTFHLQGWKGNGRGECSHCHTRQTVTTNGKLRKHKKEGN